MRKVLEPIQLPDGRILPVGCYFALNAREATFDKSGLANSYEFQGFR